jgi:DNA mismatch repair protein MutL
MIKKLEKETINLISAGEVIECPADIIKELIENAIDAKAKSITLSIKNSGIDLIEIKDDGTGISKEDLPLTIERHATSKLEKIDDLYSIETFGFRGEALSSINTVSKLKIQSSDNEDGIGYILENNSIKEIPFSRGTTIIVRDLFYNIPVRKKFLRSLFTEFSKIYNTFLEFVLLNPDIKFQFISEKKNEIFPRTTSVGRYIQVFGKDIVSKTITLNIENKIFKLSGILCKPTNYFYFPNNFLYINKRPVFSPQINKQITDAYKDYLMIQQKPFFVLFFDLDSKSLDINVHPKKRTIRIQNEFVFINQLKEELNKIFSNQEIPELKSTTTISSFLENSETVNNQQSYYFENNSPAQLQDKIEDFRYKPIIPVLPQKELMLNNQKIKSILGQIINTFIVCEIEEGMMLIDQHAAEERINLEKNREYFSDYVKVQNLIAPTELINLDLETKEFILNNQPLFKNLGFIIQEDNEKIYLITIPEFLERYFTIDFFYEIIKDIEENPKEKLDKIKDKILKLKSCKESIKANDPLSISQMINLIKQLEECKDKAICAHGRPTMLIYNKKELEKMFKRIV